MARLEGFMVPRDVMFVGELPKTATAKVSRRLLREMSADATVGVGGAPAPGPVA
jgi:acyl-coenzyme A synthetase/AMP-(fatty) acid ligase